MEGVKDLLEAPDFGTKRHLSRGKLRRSFMGNTREQEFLQAQQPVPNAELEEQSISSYPDKKIFLGSGKTG